MERAYEEVIDFIAGGTTLAARSSTYISADLRREVMVQVLARDNEEERMSCNYN
ncbi:hypothetical protein [Thiothrix fructosivorans]|uniref:Uncharacterized protein n=1 Tax=Thiothrix fructosivorans TaxID=111770 RepID=A0A8B0SHU1_9GAMM|nr:hypothetical protein [Thiothrix fructosivorans]MBO0613659.1 hypothetical protein [Thiothrix fructosivorans]QTX10926.1 hypothetical protein J1836_000670 [Thiothrix fructosivorans]